MYLAKLTLLLAYTHQLTEGRETQKLAESLSFKKNYRLPLHIKPIHYDISVMPDWNVASDKSVQTFNGIVKIHLTVLAETNDIKLNAKDLRITNATLNAWKDMKGNGEIFIREIITSPSLEMVHFSLGRSLAIGESLILTINYDARIGTNRLGFYRASYSLPTGQPSHILSTQFSPNHARRAFPCFDEPGFKATFQITITRPQHLSSLSNMPLKETRGVDFTPCQGENNFTNRIVKDSYEISPVMSTYLVAFIIHDYPSISSRTKSNILVSIYTPADMIDQADYALAIAIRGLDFYEEYFGINYPLPKLDLIGIPDFYFGAMENWGLITVRLIYLLYSPTASNLFKQSTSILLLHELAHQWFGNLVTMRWWDDLWLKEGFATYMSYVGLDALNPEWQMLKQFSKDLTLDAMTYDGKSGSHPIRQEVNNANEIASIFDTISYNKGALLIGMLDGIVLDRLTFKKGIQIFLQKFAYKNCESHDLWNALQTVNIRMSMSSNIVVEDFVSSWIDQKGFPIIQISDPFREAINNGSAFAPSLQISLSQTTFLSQFTIEGLNLKSLHNSQWKIPLKIGFGDDIKQIQIETIWLNNASVHHHLPSHNLGTFWIKGNLHYSGYYVVQYGIHVWNALVSKLKENQNLLDPLDRAEIINNLWLLQEFGHIPLVNAMEFLIYTLPQPQADAQDGLSESEALPLLSLLDFLLSITQNLKDVVTNHVRGNWKSVVINYFVEPLTNNLILSQDLTHMQTLVQSRLVKLALYLDHGPTINMSRLFYHNWLNASQTASLLPPPDLMYTTLIAGVRFGSEQDWNLIFNTYLATRVPSLKNLFLSSLGTTKDQQLLLKFLNLTIDGREFVKAQDIILIFTIAASNPTMGCSELAWNFMTTHWDVLFEKLDGDNRSLQALANNVASNFNEIEQFKLYDSFAEKHLFGVPQRSLTQTREAIISNVGWIKKNYHSLEQWLLHIKEIEP